MWVEDIFGMPGYGKPLAHLRETVELIRLIIANGHTGELERFEGNYHRHYFSQFQGTFAAPLRTDIPIWIAANQSGLTRLVGEIADGFMSHPIHSTRWGLRTRAARAAARTSQGGSLARRHPLERWVLRGGEPRPGRSAAGRPHRLVFYAQFEQYEPMFAAHGFEKEARACQEAARRKEYATAGAAAVSEEMAETFVILGSPDECRARLEEVWGVADSFCLVPPQYDLSPDKTMAYAAAIADTFYE